MIVEQNFSVKSKQHIRVIERKSVCVFSPIKKYKGFLVHFPRYGCIGTEHVAAVEFDTFAFTSRIDPFSNEEGEKLASFRIR